jgi:hypothetical protein
VRQVVLRHNLQRLLVHLPQLNCLVICRQQVVGRILSPAPFDLVYLLFYLQRLEVVEFGLVGLKLGVELVFAGLFLLVAG